MLGVLIYFNKAHQVFSRLITQEKIAVLFTADNADCAVTFVVLVRIDVPAFEGTDGLVVNANSAMFPISSSRVRYRP